MRRWPMLDRLSPLSITPRLIALSALIASTALATAQPARQPDVDATNGVLPSAITPLSPELQETLRDLLNYDPVRGNALSSTAPTYRAATPPAYDLNWNRTEKANGAEAVTVKKPLPFDVDANIGADFATASTPAITYNPERGLGPYKDTGSGAAWANMAVLPGLASVDARLDSATEQSKLGTTLGRSVPLGSQYSVTLQNSYAVSESLNGTGTPALPNTTAVPSQIWSTDRLVKFNFLNTGTSIAAGTTQSSIDNVTHRKLGVEQKLFDSFNVTTSVTDMGTAGVNKSITAGFKYKW